MVEVGSGLVAGGVGAGPPPPDDGVDVGSGVDPSSPSGVADPLRSNGTAVLEPRRRGAAVAARSNVGGGVWVGTGSVRATTGTRAGGSALAVGLGRGGVDLGGTALDAAGALALVLALAANQPAIWRTGLTRDSLSVTNLDWSWLTAASAIASPWPTRTAATTIAVANTPPATSCLKDR